MKVKVQTNASFIKSAVRERLGLTSVSDSRFDLIINDLKELKTSIKNPRLSVHVVKF